MPLGVAGGRGPQAVKPVAALRRRVERRPAAVLCENRLDDRPGLAGHQRGLGKHDAHRIDAAQAVGHIRAHDAVHRTVVPVDGQLGLVSAAPAVINAKLGREMLQEGKAAAGELGPDYPLAHGQLRKQVHIGARALFHSRDDEVEPGVILAAAPRPYRDEPPDAELVIGEYLRLVSPRPVQMRQRPALEKSRWKLHAHRFSPRRFADVCKISGATAAISNWLAIADFHTTWQARRPHSGTLARGGRTLEAGTFSSRPHTMQKIHTRGGFALP